MACKCPQELVFHKPPVVDNSSLVSGLMWLDLEHEEQAVGVCAGYGFRQISALVHQKASWARVTICHKFDSQWRAITNTKYHVN